LSGRGSEEASSVALSLPLESFLYLSTDSLTQGGNPFPGVSSQDTLFSPFLPDTALKVGQQGESQIISLSSVASEAETFSRGESVRADSSQAELPLGQFKLVKGRQRKRRRPKTERLAAGSPVKPVDAKRMVPGRLDSPARQSLETYRD
jgi:hypothetical protein